MGLVAFTCPNCGANLKVEDDRERFFCSYCGSAVERERIRLTIDGIGNARTFLERAQGFLMDGKFTSAADYYERVLDASPKEVEAYLGLFLCQVEARSIEEIQVSRIPNDLYNLTKALEYSGGAIRERFEPFLPVWNEQVRKILEDRWFTKAKGYGQFLTALFPNEPDGYIILFLVTGSVESLDNLQNPYKPDLNPQYLIRANEVSGGRYQDKVDEVRERHLDAIRASSRKVTDLEEKLGRRRNGDARYGERTAVDILRLICFVIFSFVVLMYGLLSRNPAGYYLFGIGVLGAVASYFRLRYDNKWRAALLELDSERKRLAGLQQTYESYYENRK